MLYKGFYASEMKTDLRGTALLRTDELIKDRTELVPLLALLDTACSIVAKENGLI